MRALTSIQSSTAVKADMEFHLKLSDQSTTFIFNRDDIAELTPINWEIPFGGGFGKPSNYQVTLSTSVDFIKTYKKQIVNGEGSLKIFVNSDNFVPSIGRVRDIQRFPKNLNQLQLNVYDKFLDTNPKIPIQSIVDSYSGAHPEVINSDMGYPLYYGKHTRPFYMTPVDCSLAIMLGPLNISSANHNLTEMWYETKLFDPNDLSKYPMPRYAWSQQSGADNTCTGSAVSPNAQSPFEITRQGSETDFYGTTPVGLGSQFYHYDVQTLTDRGSIVKTEEGYSQSWPYRIYNTGGTAVDCRISMQELTFSLNKEVAYFNTLVGTATISGVTSAQIGVWRVDFKLFKNGNIANQTNLATTSTDLTISWTRNYGLSTATDFGKVFTPRTTKIPYIHGRYTGIATTFPKFTFRLTSYLGMASSAWSPYSVYGTLQSCSDIAISENPMGIVADIIDQTSFSFIASQNSQAQYSTSSYNFQAFMGERESLTTILNEFGVISSTYMWIGDSGFINFNTYQQSSTLVESGLIAATITTCDFLDGSLRILDNPLGTTVFNTKKASRIKVDYDYDFGTQLYNKSNVANPQNNAFCESADASGIQTQITVQTKYIKEAFTSSLYLSNIARHSTQDEMIVEMDLPARFFNLELSDVVKFQHPVLVGSESLFQITKIKPDYLGGVIRMTANEILNL